ncbi:hypothetical protein BC826DRAFT_1055583 [Russula brevipes]|nr:hypothetical protein BC826DRAFT_1055583 [Russula brevipes]
MSHVMFRLPGQVTLYIIIGGRTCAQRRLVCRSPVAKPWGLLVPSNPLKFADLCH